MKYKSGEVATLLVLGVIAVLSIATAVGSYVVNNQKTSVNSRAETPVPAVCYDGEVMDGLDTPAGYQWIARCNERVGSVHPVKFCTVSQPANDQCRTSTSDPSTYWCFGFSSLPSGKGQCLELVSKSRGALGDFQPINQTPSNPPAQQPNSDPENNCRDNPVITAGYTWKSLCAKDANNNPVKTCVTNADCMPPASLADPEQYLRGYGITNVEKESDGKTFKTWCYGFGDGPKCMYLVKGQQASQPVAQQPQPTSAPVQQVIPTLSPIGLCVDRNLSTPKPYDENATWCGTSTYMRKCVRVKNPDGTETSKIEETNCANVYTNGVCSGNTTSGSCARGTVAQKPVTSQPPSARRNVGQSCDSQNLCVNGAVCINGTCDWHTVSACEDLNKVACDQHPFEEGPPGADGNGCKWCQSSNSCMNPNTGSCKELDDSKKCYPEWGEYDTVDECLAFYASCTSDTRPCYWGATSESANKTTNVTTSSEAIIDISAAQWDGSGYIFN